MTPNVLDHTDSAIRAIVARHGARPESLLPILLETQRTFRAIDERAMEVIAVALALPPARVHGVASFHTFLDRRPRGWFAVRLCRTLSCMLAGRDAVAHRLETDLGIRFGETTADGLFSLDWVSCLGLCDQGPAMMVGDRVYGQVTIEKVHEVLEECRGEAVRTRSMQPETDR
ncbi:MAG TPA: NAD(P)H-dependent oxidoreductase subunit E [Polyangia bacterium]|nr:NAD(P)H-dependent oxidoreductase subunit E [Polyangia bacterium]